LWRVLMLIMVVGADADDKKSLSIDSGIFGDGPE
jgi:hypothetical protein